MLPRFECKICGHTWIPRTDKKPKICPVCKRRNWEIGKDGTNNKTNNG